MRLSGAMLVRTRTQIASPLRSFIIICLLSLALSLKVPKGAFAFQLRREIATLPSSPVVVQLSEAPGGPGSPVITHSHMMGWILAVEGEHHLKFGDRVALIREGSADWVPEGLEHTHGWEYEQRSSKSWFLGIGTNLSSSTPSGFRYLALSEPLQGLRAGPHIIQLEDQSFPDTRSRNNITTSITGPFLAEDSTIVLVGVKGTVEVRDGFGPDAAVRKVISGQVVTLQSGTRRHFYQPSGQLPAQVLILGIYPKP